MNDDEGMPRKIHILPIRLNIEMKCRARVDNEKEQISL